MKQKKRIKLSIKTAGATLFTAIFISLIISIFSIIQISSSLLESSREHAASIAAVAASFVDGSEFETLEPGDEDTEAFQKIFDDLSYFLEDPKIAYIYSMAKKDGELQFVVDTDVEDGASLGEPYETYDEIEEALLGNVTIDSEVTTDEWGSFYSAFAPIYNGDEVVGIVGVDCRIDDINAQIGQMRGKLILIGILSVIPGLILSLIVGKLMTQNVQTINVKMDELASNDGDLTQELAIKSNDELGQVADSFNRFLGKLKVMVLAVKDKENRLSEVTANTNQQIADSVAELEKIADSLKEMSQTMHDTNSSVSEISVATGTAKELSSGVFQTAKEQASYALEIRDRADAMQKNSAEIKEKIAAQTKKISDALLVKVEEAEQVEKIAELTQEILSISSQTRMLSLNASIEAARAGDSGRGFAVVADEIGKLADETAQTASQIVEINEIIVNAVNALSETAGSMIRYMQTEVQEDYDALAEVSEAYSKDAADFMGQMDNFSELSQKLYENLGRIEDNVNQITAVIEEETASIESVTDNTARINEKMQTINSDSQKNEQIVEELQDVLSKFTV